MEKVECPICKGWGTLIVNDGHGGTDECFECQGSGEVSKDNKMVKIASK